MPHLDVEWLDQDAPVTLSELSQMTQLSVDELTELMEYGAVTPVAAEQGNLLFPANCISLMRKAAHVRRAYDLELFAMVVLLDHLGRIERLEEQIRSMQSGVPPTLRATAVS